MTWLWCTLWGLGALAWCLVWLDARQIRPYVPTRLRRPLLWTLGALLTAGVGVALYRALSGSKRATRPPRPPVVLEGGTMADHVEREKAAADLAARAEATDATLTPRSDPLSADERRNLRERLRNRGILDPLDK
jgi:hypothetical protein